MGPKIVPNKIEIIKLFFKNENKLTNKEEKLGHKTRNQIGKNKKFISALILYKYK